MDGKQFHKRIKQILASAKQSKYDSLPAEIHDAFHNEILRKSGGVWNKEIAARVMKQLEWAFNVQPEAVLQAAYVKEPDVIKALKGFLSKRGYSYSHIDEAMAKTPEGYIDGFDKKYLCEVKSPELKFDHKAGAFGYKHATSHRKILGFVHTAIKQFDAQDSKHELPHILIYTSAHPQLHWKVFTDAIRGGVVDQKGNKLPDLSGTQVYQSTQGIIRDIDGYIWFQVGSNKQFHQASYFVNKCSDHERPVHELFYHLHKKKLSNLGLDNFIEF